MPANSTNPTTREARRRGVVLVMYSTTCRSTRIHVRATRRTSRRNHEPALRIKEDQERVGIA